MGDEGASAIANCLKSSICVMELDISNNNINDTGMAEIFSMLLVNKTIISLNVSSSYGLNRNKFHLRAARVLQKVL